MTNKNVKIQPTNPQDPVLVPSRELEVTWFDNWHPAIDEALQSLPNRETCSHDLFSLLVQTPDDTRKRVALVTEQGIPVATIGLRQLGRYFYELLTWVIVPDPMFPAKTDYWMPALEALGVEVFVTWRRMASPPPPSRLIRYQETIPIYQISCSADFENYWRQSGHWNTVNKCRKRCENFTFTVNGSGAAESIIRNWGSTWDMKPVIVNDSILVAKYLEDQGRHYSLMLLDQDKPIAGHTFFLHRNEVVWVHTFRDPAYDSQGVGTRLMDLAFHWAAESGFEAIDLGGRHDYKIRWAPQESEATFFSICPEPLFRAKQFVGWARKIQGNITNWIHHSNQVQVD